MPRSALLPKHILHPQLQAAEFSLDDVTFPACKIPDFEWKDVDLTTQLTSRITLKAPIMSSPMDTVTEAEMAILMALMGGIGVIHYNFPTIEAQMRQVQKVRRFEAGFIKTPIVLGPDATVGTVYEQHTKNGFYSYPITEDGTLEGKLIGIVTETDIRYKENMELNIAEVMTKRANMTVAHRRNTLDKNDIRTANAIIRDKNLETLPIVDNQDRVVALVTNRDLKLDKTYTTATKDDNKQLKVLVAVESRFEDNTKERIMAAREMGASGIVIDARNIYKDQLDIAKFTKKSAPELDVIVGNVVMPQAVVEVMKAVGEYVDAFRIGIGTGEVCTTSEELGIGRALGSSIYDIANAVAKYRRRGRHIGLIADGGIKSPKHIVASLMLGADAAMMGSLLAGLSQSPFKERYDPQKRMWIKEVRGMGSAEAIAERGSHRYGVDQNAVTQRFAEGIKKEIPYRGDGHAEIQRLTTGIRQTVQGLGARTVDILRRDAYLIPTVHAESKGTL